MRAEKLEEQKRQEEEQKKSSTDNTVLDKKKLIDEVMCGREISDMYLKHPGNESSSDEEGTEQEPVVGEYQTEFQINTAKAKRVKNISNIIL